MCVLQKLPVIAIRYDKKILDTNQCCEISSTWLDIAAPSIISQFVFLDWGAKYTH